MEIVLETLRGCRPTIPYVSPTMGMKPDPKPLWSTCHPVVACRRATIVQTILSCKGGRLQNPCSPRESITARLCVARCLRKKCERRAKNMPFSSCNHLYCGGGATLTSPISMSVKFMHDGRTRPGLRRRDLLAFLVGNT
jgi:hypothetical protein